MKIKFNLLLLLCFCSYCHFAWNDPDGSFATDQSVYFPGTPDTALKLDSIVEAHLVAIGGSAWDSIETAAMKINLVLLNAPSLKTEMAHAVVNGRAYRTDMSNDFSQTTICVDGNKGWSIGKVQGQTIKSHMEPAEIQELRYQVYLSSPLHQYKEKGYSVSFVGMDTVEGRPHYIVKVAFEPVSTYLCYLDSVSFQETKRVMEAPSKGVSRKIEMYFSDYQPVMGALMPRRMEVSNARGTMIFEYKEIQLNVPVDDGLFVMPE